MRKIETEVLVIGAGLAGTSAGLSVSGTGKKALVLARDGGASAMSSGALDIADDILAVRGKPEHWSKAIEKNLEQILIRFPNHPYHLLGDDAKAVIEEIKNAFALVFPAEDKFIIGDGKNNRYVFNQLGAFKSTAFTQNRMLGIDDLALGKNCLLVNFQAFRDFALEFFKNNFLYWTEKLGAKIKLEICEIPSNGIKSKSSLEMAKWINENFDQTLSQILKEIKNRNAEIIIFPPILPQEKRQELLNRVEGDGKNKAYELLSIPPSAPGKRLQRYLEQKLRRAGVEKILGKVVGFKKENKKLISVQAKTHSEGIEVFAEKFILASGGFLAGGIKKQGEFKEDIFGLKIFYGSKPVGKIFAEKLTSIRIVEPHPVFSLGVKTDQSLRALDEDGKIGLENLLIAGSIVGGGNYIFNGDGAGVALTTGLYAGKILAKSI